jgi:hypothetical protein
MEYSFNLKSIFTFESSNSMSFQYSIMIIIILIKKGLLQLVFVRRSTMDKRGLFMMEYSLPLNSHHPRMVY